MDTRMLSFTPTIVEFHVQSFGVGVVCVHPLIVMFVMAAGVVNLAEGGKFSATFKKNSNFFSLSHSEL